MENQNWETDGLRWPSRGPGFVSDLFWGGKVLLKTYIFQLGISFLRCRVERDTDVSGGQSAFENIYFPT